MEVGGFGWRKSI